jgi:DNA polymerase-1
MSDLYLIDGSGIAYRAFFAIGNWMQNSEGVPTNATFGVARMLYKLIQDYVKKDTDSVVFVMDKKTTTYRHELLDTYKANRPKAPEEFIQQLPYIIEIVEHMGVKTLGLENYEADDVIATMATERSKDFDNVYIITSDKDMMQLVKDNVYILRPEKGTSDIVKYDREQVYKKMGVYPEQINDLLALMGDSADNIPGVKGIGIKTAQKLLKQYDNLEKIYENIEDVKGASKKKLIDDKDNAFMSQKLVRLMYDAPLDFEDGEMEYNGPKDSLTEYLKELDFSSLIKDMELEDEKEDEDKEDYSKKIEYKLIKPEELDKFIKNTLSKSEKVSFDLETNSLDPIKAEIYGVALATKAFEGFYLDVSKLDKDEKEKTIKNLLDALKNKKIIGQNLKYDISVLKSNGFAMDEIYFDTMIGAYLLNPDSRKFNMDDLAKKYLNYETIKYDDLIGTKLFASDIKDLNQKDVVKYAGEDADITFRLYNVISKELEKKEMANVLHDIEMPIVPILSEMENNGVYFDKNELKKLEIEFQKKIDKVYEEMVDMADYEFNPNSPKQVGELLYDNLGLKGKKKTKNGSYSTDAESLEFLRNKHPIAEKLLEYRKYQKLQSTYVQAIPKLINEKTGRIHTSFNQTGTSTGRLSSSEPNLQNIPIKDEEGERIRKTVSAQKDGWILISADYSQIELRVLAHLTKDETLLKAYNEDKDIHAITSSQIFGVNLDEVTTDMRRVGKMVNFSLVYGASPYGLSQKLNISFKEAKKFIDRYFKLYKKVEENQENAIKLAKEKGYVETLFGRKRFVKNIRTGRHDIKRIAINTPIQGTAADIMKFAMIKVYKNLPDYAKMILQIHDEIVLEIPEDKTDVIKSILIENMENAVKLDVPLKADVSIGKYWSK